MKDSIHVMLCTQFNFSDGVLACRRPSRLLGIVTQPVGVPPFEVIAFSNS